MKCRFVSEQLGAYLDDELQPRLAAEVKAHLDACETCRAEFQRLRELTGLLHDLPRLKAPEGLKEQVTSRIERALLLSAPAPRHPRRVVLRRLLQGAALAAALVLLVLGAYVAFFSVLSSPPAVSWDVAGLRKDQAAPFSPFRWDDDADRSTRPAFDEGASLEKREGELASKQGETPPRTSGGLVGKGILTAPAVVAKPAPSGSTPDFEGPTFELSQAAGRTEQPPPAEPQVLNLVVSADDFDAAKKRILAVADSLNIRAVNDLPQPLADAFKSKSLAGVSGNWTAETAETPAPKTAPEAKYRDARLAVESGRPALILALEEDKLPSLVARLSAHRPAANEKIIDYVASVNEPADGRLEAQSAGAPETPPPSRPGDRTAETRALSGKDATRPVAPPSPPPAATTSPAPARPAEVTKLADDADIAKERRAQLPRLLYIRIFLARPLPAADAKPAEVPAPK